MKAGNPEYNVLDAIREANEGQDLAIVDLAKRAFEAQGLVIPTLAEATRAATRTTTLVVNGFRQEPLGIGGKTGIELVEVLTNAGININAGIRDRLLNPAFVIHPNPEEIMTVRGSVRDLGLNRPSTLAQIQKGAANLGFELCSTEAVVYQRLKDRKQPLRNAYWMITADRYGYPNLFVLECHERGLWLHGHWAHPDYGWAPVDEFVFSLPASKT